MNYFEKNDLIGKVNQSSDVIEYIKELIDYKYIENVVVFGHTNFSCTLTDKCFEEKT